MPESDNARSSWINAGHRGVGTVKITPNRKVKRGPKMISINEAIESGAWLNVVCNYPAFYKHACEIKFRLRLREFAKIDLLAVFTPEEFSNYKSSHNVWLLRMDIVPMNKQGLTTQILENLLYLTDENRSKFKFCANLSLTYFSSFARTSGLWNFARSRDLQPKISKSGAYAYELPEFFDKMKIDVHDGQITEV